MVDGMALLVDDNDGLPRFCFLLPQLLHSALQEGKLQRSRLGLLPNLRL